MAAATKWICARSTWQSSNRRWRVATSTAIADGTAKDKLEDMDVSLIKEGVRLVAIIFRTCLQPNRWTYITSLGTKWKIWILSFQRYLIIHCRSNGLVMALVQSWVVFDVFQKMAINPKWWKKKFWWLFLKCSNLKTNKHRDMKPTANGHQYPKFL